jgi:glycosyltransferase involved in cell wall biosynthesis
MLIDKRHDQNIAVVIPSYKVTKHILSVIDAIPNLVSKVYVVDDCCPDRSGEYVLEKCSDPRVSVIRNDYNLGVGGAVITGYRAAKDNGSDIIVKIDGDGQMDPSLIEAFIEPIKSGRADYTKGNRFFDLERIRKMPALRIFGNAGLSFITKLSSGYWQIFDPTNGYTAIHARLVDFLPLSKISNRYFFESDMLFRLNCLRAVVVDIPMHAKYDDEESNLRISRVLGLFARKNIENMFKRIFYNYFLRDITAASFELVIGFLLLVFGVTFGATAWEHSSKGVLASSGTVMLAALPTMLGIQFLMAFINFDISNQPRDAIWPRLKFKSMK